jgi:hypothetical protein
MLSPVFESESGNRYGLEPFEASKKAVMPAGYDGFIRLSIPEFLKTP